MLLSIAVLSGKYPLHYALTAFWLFHESSKTTPMAKRDVQDMQLQWNYNGSYDLKGQQS